MQGGFSGLKGEVSTDPAVRRPKEAFIQRLAMFEGGESSADGALEKTCETRKRRQPSPEMQVKINAVIAGGEKKLS